MPAYGYDVLHTYIFFFFFSSRRRHTRFDCDWSSDVCSSDLWDEPDDVPALRALAAELGLGFDAVNSNTFQDQPGQPLSYKLGSFSHPDAAVRRQAVAHHLHVIEVGQALGAEAITVWLADGSNYPGQMSLRKSFDRVLDCLRDVYAALPAGWRLFTEHKPYEPAFYATVVQDWGSSLLLA